MKVKINDVEKINITKHDGKLKGLLSLSTNKLLNTNCKKMMALDTICKHCYVDDLFKLRKNLEPCLTNNFNILTNRILNKQEIENLSIEIKNQIIFRFESFGDLENEIQLINYINVAKACKYTKFALFTKHTKIILDYFRKGLKMPKNITLVISNPFMDTPLKENFLNVFKRYHERTISFSVTSDKNNPKINCGKRKCIECRNCYDAKKPHNVIELLK